MAVAVAGVPELAAHQALAGVVVVALVVIQTTPPLVLAVPALSS
jgi:hypothetical protein